MPRAFNYTRIYFFIFLLFLVNVKLHYQNSTRFTTCLIPFTRRKTQKNPAQHNYASSKTPSLGDQLHHIFTNMFNTTAAPKFSSPWNLKFPSIHVWYTRAATPEKSTFLHSLVHLFPSTDFHYTVLPQSTTSLRVTRDQPQNPINRLSNQSQCTNRCSALSISTQNSQLASWTHITNSNILSFVNNLPSTNSHKIKECVEWTKNSNFKTKETSKRSTQHSCQRR